MGIRQGFVCPKKGGKNIINKNKRLKRAFFPKTDKDGVWRPSDGQFLAFQLIKRSTFEKIFSSVFEKVFLLFPASFRVRIESKSFRLKRSRTFFQLKFFLNAPEVLISVWVENNSESISWGNCFSVYPEKEPFLFLFKLIIQTVLCHQCNFFE